MGNNSAPPSPASPLEVGDDSVRGHQGSPYRDGSGGAGPALREGDVIGQATPLVEPQPVADGEQVRDNASSLLSFTRGQALRRLAPWAQGARQQGKGL